MTRTFEILHRLLVAVVVAAALNIVFLLAHGSAYDYRIGFLHLVAHGAFKPLLILTGAFLLTVLCARAKETESVSGAAAPATLAVLTILALTFSLTVNPLDDEWNYRGLSSTYPTLGGVAHLFASAQIGVWYRPLGFASLWLDHSLFHDHFWAYHLQNILLHMANALLIVLLARRLGLAHNASRWAGALFLAAAVTYEPAMWPSARFDLWALFFTLLALLASARFLTGHARTALAAALVCYVLAICSKESGYAFPILLAIMAAASPFEPRPFATRRADRRRRLIELGFGVLIVTLAMIAIRKAVLGGAGGYAGTSTTPSIHFSFNLATLRDVLMRAMQMSTLAVNLSYPSPKIVLLVIGSFAALLAVAALAGAAAGSRRILVLYVLAATVPVAPLISWLDFHAQHVRYLYMPAAFVAMLLAAALSNARYATPLLFVFGALNLSCGFYNTWVYKATYQNSTELARSIATDQSGQPSPLRVTVIGMPLDYDGVLFSRLELQYRLGKIRPDAQVTFEDRGACSNAQCYVWLPEQRSLRRFGS